MPTLTTNNALLAAGGVFNTGGQNTDPEYPYVTVLVSSDQNGSLSIYERGDGQELEEQTILNAAVAGGAVPALFNFPLRQQHWRIAYTNGATAQGAFSITYANNPLAADLSQANLLWLILKELRAHSMLLDALRGPSSVQVNVPYGVDYKLGT